YLLPKRGLLWTTHVLPGTRCRRWVSHGSKLEETDRASCRHAVPDLWHRECSSSMRTERTPCLSCHRPHGDGQQSVPDLQRRVRAVACWRADAWPCHGALYHCLSRHGSHRKSPRRLARSVSGRPYRFPRGWAWLYGCKWSRLPLSTPG